jgi:hypothetical protein
MSGVSLPVTRPAGRALVVGSASSRAQPLSVLQGLGFTCAELDDPYHAMAELCRRPLVYRALILSLSSLFREELPLIASVKRRFPHIDVWITHLEGRQAFLAEAMRLGADGLLADDGLHRTAMGPPPAEDTGMSSPISMPRPAAPPAASEPGAADDAARESREPRDSRKDLAATVAASGPADDENEPVMIDDEPSANEPVLTADELRALLQEQPMLPPSGDE